MAFDVFVYDNGMTPLNNPRIEFLETDKPGTTLAIQTNAAIGTSFGAVLPPPVPPVPISIWIRDRSHTWSAASLGYLKGSVAARLHVTLFPTPSPGAIPGPGGRGPGRGPSGGPSSPRSPGGASGSTPMSVSDVAPLIEARVRTHTWTVDEGNAVRSLVDTASRALLLANPGEVLSEWLDDWLEQLEGLGISLKRHRSARGGSHGGSPIVEYDPEPTQVLEQRYMTTEE